MEDIRQQREYKAPGRYKEASKMLEKAWEIRQQTNLYKTAAEADSTWRVTEAGAEDKTANAPEAIDTWQS